MHPVWFIPGFSGFSVKTLEPEDFLSTIPLRCKSSLRVYVAHVLPPASTPPSYPPVLIRSR